MTDDIRQRIEKRLASRQAFFSLVEDIRTRQKKIAETWKATKAEWDELNALLERCDNILLNAAGVMLNQGIIKPSAPSRYNGGVDFSYCSIPPLFDYEQASSIPPLMDFSFTVMMMRKWQMTKANAHKEHKMKCYSNCFYWQDKVDKIIKKGWLWDQTQATKIMLNSTINHVHEIPSNRSREHHR